MCIFIVYVCRDDTVSQKRKLNVKNLNKAARQRPETRERRRGEERGAVQGVCSVTVCFGKSCYTGAKSRDTKHFVKMWLGEYVSLCTRNMNMRQMHC